MKIQIRENDSAALWVTYHNMLTLFKDFIRAERLHDYNMRLSALALMLPYFVAAGRGQYGREQYGRGQYAKALRLYLGQYAKALRLYLEQHAIFEVKYGALLKTFKVTGPGVWTDLSIEHSLMRAAKFSSGLTSWTGFLVVPVTMDNTFL